MKKLLVLFLGTVLFFSACDRKHEKDNQSIYNAEKVNIGLLLPLTGNGALYGQYVKEGALLAVSELSSSRFNLIIEDTRTTAKDGISSVNKLILKDKAPIIAGPMSSTVAKSVAKICQDKKVVIITTASAPEIASLGNYIYRIYPSDSFDGSFLAHEIVKQSLSKSVVIYLNNDFGEGMVKVFEKVYKGVGAKVVAKFPFSPNQKDFSTLVSRLKGYEFDNFFIVATQKEYINIINKMENLNYTYVPIFAPVNIEDKTVVDAISSKMLNNIQYSKPNFDLDHNLTKVQNRFKDLWSKSFKEKANIFNAYGYDMVHLTNKLIKETKDGNYKATLDNYNALGGATGNYRFDESGDVVRSFSLLKLKDL